MRKALALSCLLVTLPLILPAAEFDWMVREFSRESGLQQTHIPFFGLARLAVAVAHPAGTSELKMAIFEHANIEAANFARMSDSVLGNNWRPIVRVRSRSGEATNIYMQPDGKHIRLILATLSGTEASLIELRLRPDSLIRFVDEQRSKHANP